MTVSITGRFPPLLYRAFAMEGLARCFVEQGRFRLSPLENYRVMETVGEERADKDEGEARLDFSGERPVFTVDLSNRQVVSRTTEHGLIHWGRSPAGPCFVLCFSGPAVDIEYLKGKYGPYVVRVNSPDLLVADIAAYVEQCADLPYGKRLACVRVRYDKGCPAPCEPSEEEKEALSFGQKAPAYSRDCEYRIVLMLPFTGNDPPGLIDVRLGKKLAYAEVM